MIWNTYLAEIVPSINLGDYAIQIWGPFALVVLGLLAVVVIQYRQGIKKDLVIEQKQAKIDELQEKRLQDSKDSATAKALPADEITRFVGNLYELSKQQYPNRGA